MPSGRISSATVGVLLLLPLAVGGTQPVALLLAGPERRVGVPALGPNAVASHTARYEFGEHEVRVSYAASQLPVPADWQEQRCGGLTVYVSAPAGPFEVLVLGGEPLPLLVFEFPPEASAEPGSWCPFAERVVERFTYFQGFVEAQSDVAFPAVIELSLPGA